jgi:hypothetical protein
MATPTSPRTVLSDQQIADVLGLIKQSDSVELKLTVPEEHQRSTLASLGVDPLNAQIRQVFFFETRELALDAAGVVVRARRMQGRSGDSAVKLRPVVPSELPSELRTSASFRVEVDALPGGYVCSGTMKGTPTNDEVKSAVAGERTIRKLFSKEQRAYYADHAPEGIGLDDLIVLGPIFVLKGKFEVPEFPGRRLVAEVWMYPDGSRVLELSTRCETNEAFQVSAELRAYLTAQGIDLTGDQETKTKKALSFFSAALHGEE